MHPNARFVRLGLDADLKVRYSETVLRSLTQAEVVGSESIRFSFLKSDEKETWSGPYPKPRYSSKP